jgi:hypothetical protein
VGYIEPQYLTEGNGHRLLQRLEKPDQGIAIALPQIEGRVISVSLASVRTPTPSRAVR